MGECSVDGTSAVGHPWSCWRVGYELGSGTETARTFTKMNVHVCREPRTHGEDAFVDENCPRTISCASPDSGSCVPRRSVAHRIPS
jgi:hypothetical protein